jgi:orotate phosphoribosyltransferase-like protein
MAAATFRTSYMDAALFDLPSVIETARERLAGVDFDTLVGTGFSGGVVIPALALALGKKFVLIRKDTDDSHHGAGRLIGELGERWIFVDDFISSGRTRTRVVEKIAEGLVQHAEWNPPTSTTFVGQYMYVNYSDEGPTFEPFVTNWIGASE